MKQSNLFLIGLIIGLLLGSIVMYFIRKADVEEVKVPVVIRVQVPESSGVFDPIFNPKPLPELKSWTERIIDSSYYKQYIALKDSISKDSLYKEAISIRDYKTTFENDEIKIDVHSQTRGWLLYSKPEYLIKEKEFVLDTTLTVPVPQQAKFYGGGIVTLPHENSIVKPSISPQLMLLEKKGKKAWNLNYDFINKVGELGVLFKF